jgi:hypothetical protein
MCGASMEVTKYLFSQIPESKQVRPFTKIAEGDRAPEPTLKK